MSAATKHGSGTSRSYANAGAATVSAIVVVIAVLLVWYAAAMKRRAVLG